MPRSFYLLKFFLVMSMAVLCLSPMAYAAPPVSSPTAQTVQPFFEETQDISFPDKISLCGEKMPIEDRHVWEMMDREFTIAVWDTPQVYMWLKRKGRYFPYIEKSLAERDMPDDLKYLAVAESSLLTTIVSNRSALGLWQFMADTARHMGLRVDRDIDERLHFERSTQAALSFIKLLKNELGTWTLALSAYNSGGARVKQEMEEQQVNNYYRLNLPLETERFIYRIAAAKIIIANPERYGFNLPAERTYPPMKTVLVKVKLNLPIPILEVAQALNLDYKALREMNPHVLLSRQFPIGEYEITVPEGLEDNLHNIIKQLIKKASREATLPPESRFYVVQPGDTLIGISLKTGLTVSKIKRLNNIEGSVIKYGQKLRLEP